MNTGNASHAENPPLVRVRLNRLFGTSLSFVLFELPLDCVSVFIPHWRPKVAASGTQRR